MGDVTDYLAAGYPKYMCILGTNENEIINIL